MKSRNVLSGILLVSPAFLRACRVYRLVCTRGILSRRPAGLLLIILFLLPASSPAGQWYVAPNGNPDNSGTQNSPWDIASALNGEHAVSPGDTIYLLGGTYKRRPEALFEVRLKGTAEKPIHVRPSRNARVRIDGGLSIQSPSEHVWIRDIEIFVSEPVPEKPISPGSHPEDLNRPWGGLHLYGGKNCKYINLVIHNCNQGISAWKGEIDPEIYGCIIYDNGWLGTDRGHGHCIYTQNDQGTKTISNCIMTCRYDGTYTMHAYGSSRAFVNNFLVERCIFYDKGPFLVGGGKPSKNIKVFGNYLYNVTMRLGYNAPHNENCEVRDNLIVNGDLTFVRYKDVIDKNNLIVKEGQERPKGIETALLPNEYDPNRAHLVIYNWKEAQTAEIPTEEFLQDGDSFRLMDPKNLFGIPVFEGRCRGNAIRIPVKAEFAAFVLIKRS